MFTGETSHCSKAQISQDDPGLNLPITTAKIA